MILFSRSVHSFAQTIDRASGLILLLVTPLYLFPGGWRDLAMLVVPLLWGLAFLARRNPLPISPLNASVLVLTLMLLVSLYATYDIAYSLPKIAGMLLGIGWFFMLLRAAQTAKGLRTALAVFLAVGLGVAGLGLLGMQAFNKFTFLQPLVSRLPLFLRDLPGAENGFHPNEVAGALLWLLPLLLALVGLAIIRLRHARRFGAILGSLILLGVTVFVAGVFSLTQSRTALIAMAAALLLAPGVLLTRKWRWAYWAGGILLAAGLIVTAWNLGWVAKLYAATNSAGASSSSFVTLNGRVEIWSRAIYGIQDFPFTGMGMNTFRTVVNVLYPLFSFGPDFDIGHAHNEFLQAALDLGLPGLIAFLSLYIIAFWMLFQTWRGANLPPASGESVPIGGFKALDGLLSSSLGMKAIVLGLGGGLLAHALFGLTDAVALGAKPGLLFWMLLGLVAGLYQQQRSRTVPEND